MTQTSERAALVAAIKAAALAEQALADAQAAATRARDRFFEVDRQIDLLNKQIEEAEGAPPDALITALTSTDDVDIAVLDRPIADLREQLASAEHEADRWRRARDLAEQSIPVRAQALDFARMRVDSAAREVMRVEVNVAALLCAAEADRAAVIRREAELRALAGALAHTSDERRTIEDHLSKAWLREAGCPSAQRIADAFTKMKSDADATLQNLW